MKYLFITLLVILFSCGKEEIVSKETRIKMLDEKIERRELYLQHLNNRIEERCTDTTIINFFKEE